MAARTPSNTSSPATPRLLRTRDESLNMCDMENDDEAEKRERQKIRVLELQKSAQSPLSDRRLSISNVISGLSNAQLAEHYTNCIKLSSENKITMKNAFNLHLIDYMQSMMKKKNSEMDNFQVASCTLDASTKIYASRVDYVHAETFKIAGGFCRNGEKSKKNKTHGEDGATDDGGGGDGDENGPTPVKRRKIKRKNTVEHNLKNINLNKIDEEYTFDPLYQKMRLTFDEGGTSSLLLNSLSSKDDGSELQFDSKEPAFPPPTVPKPKPSRNIDLTSIKEILLKISKDDKQICPEFADFTFINWNPNDLYENSDCTVVDSVKSNLAFDDAAENYFGDENGIQSEDENENGGGDADFFHNSDNADENVDPMGDNIQNKNRGRKSLDLLAALATEPSEYSYFNVDFLRTWAGAEHWHPMPKFLTNKKTTQPQPRKVKEAFSVKFTDENLDDDEFQKTKRSNKLTEKTLTEIWSKKKTTLPRDLHYNAEELHKLFLKPKLKIGKKKSSRHVDDVIEQYDYDNPNDCENFCPPQTDNNPDISRDLFSFEDTVVDNNTVIGFTADNLVQQPYKVEKISVQYARTAKKIDVQKLKSSMWKLLKTNVVVDDKQKDEMMFTCLYEKLPSEVTGKTLENLSVPIAFVCLLYLANEKELEITNFDNLADLVIKTN